jgi:hypothetical protein
VIAFGSQQIAGLFPAVRYANCSANLSLEAFAPRNFMKVVYVTGLFSALRLSTQVMTHGNELAVASAERKRKTRPPACAALS